jgi:CRISPR system Cascade subunit CasE
MTVFLSRIRLVPRATGDSRFWQRVQDAYHAHSLIWDLFSDGPERERDFLFRQEEHRGLPGFLTVSSRAPSSRNGTWIVETKPYAPVLREGQQLGFVLRANPVRTVQDPERRHHRHDVVMDAKRRLRTEPTAPLPSLPEIVQEAGAAWLAGRALQHGFTFSPGEVSADGYTQLRLVKEGSKAPIRLSTIDFSGRLTVTDPERFRAALTTGIGPAKGFGCGLLLVRPV